MDIALDSLILFLLIIIPGISFRRFYFQGEFTKQFNSKTLAHSLSASVLPGLIVQTVTLVFYNSFIKEVDGQSILKVYENLSTNKLTEIVFDVESLWMILSYVAVMLVMSWIMAEFSWNLVRFTRADRWWKVLRFKNHWNYYFKGELKGFKEYKNLIQGKLIEVRADILVNIENNDPRLYSGVLSQHTINNNTHELENVYLTRVSIYKKGNNDEKRVPKFIPGDVMIISAKDIININLKYITVEKISNLPIVFDFINLILAMFIIFSRYDYFSSNTLLKTILLKIFFIIYFITVTTLIQSFFKKKNKELNNTIFGLIILFVFMSIFYYVFRYIIF